MAPLFAPVSKVKLHEKPRFNALCNLDGRGIPRYLNEASPGIEAERVRIGLDHMEVDAGSTHPRARRCGSGEQ